MIVPGIPERPRVLSRWLIAVAAGSIGIMVGWKLTRGEMPVASWFLPVASLASAALLAIELVRARSRQALWAACLCGLIGGRAVYELVQLAIGR
jgi:hypothetical protein